LNQDDDTKISLTGVGAPGNEGTYFGPATLRAVIKFQEKHSDDVLKPAGITKGNGYIGALTRSKIRSLCRDIVKGGINGNSGQGGGQSGGNRGWDDNNGQGPRGNDDRNGSGKDGKNEKPDEYYFPNSKGPISLITPNAGERLIVGETISISWTAENIINKQNPRFALYLIPEGPKCASQSRGDVACAIGILPFTIAREVSGFTSTTTYSWKVGEVVESHGILAGNRYNIRVCTVGSNTECTQTFKGIFLVDRATVPALDPVRVSVITPKSTISGNEVTMYGFGFTEKNNLIKFGDGYAGNVDSQAFSGNEMGDATRPSVYNNVRKITFRIPSYQMPACVFSTVSPCMIATGTPLRAGFYEVRVLNANGTSSSAYFDLRAQ
jgi:hypothetical protein